MLSHAAVYGLVVERQHRGEHDYCDMDAVRSLTPVAWYFHCYLHFPCRPITLPSSFTQQGYLNIPVGPTSVIAAILYALPPAYSNCSLSLVEHATAASANVTLLSA